MASKRPASPDGTELKIEKDKTKKRKISPRTAAKRERQVTQSSTQPSDTPTKKQYDQKPRGSNNSKSKKTNLSNTHITAKETKSSLVEKIRNLDAEVQSLRTQLRSAIVERNVAKTQTRLLQERQIANSQQGRQYLQDDETIKQSLSDLSKTISDWCREWAIKGPVAANGMEGGMATMARMINGIQKISTRAIRDDTDEKDLSQHGTVRAATHTIVEHVVAKRLLVSPFHFLASGSGLDTGLTEASLTALQSVMNVQSPETALWAARTLRSLYLPYQSKSSPVEPIEDDILYGERSKICKDLNKLCLQGHESLLFGLLEQCNTSQEARRSKGLSTIFEVAAKLSLQMWIQGATVTAHWQGSEIYAQGFEPEDMRCELHPSMTPDSFNASFAGRTVDWVVRPCVTFKTYHADGTCSAPVVGLKALVILLDDVTHEPEVPQDPFKSKIVPVENAIETPKVPGTSLQEWGILESPDNHGKYLDGTKDGNQSSASSDTRNLDTTQTSGLDMLENGNGNGTVRRDSALDMTEKSKVTKRSDVDDGAAEATSRYSVRASMQYQRSKDYTHRSRIFIDLTNDGSSPEWEEVSKEALGGQPEVDRAMAKNVADLPSTPGVSPGETLSRKTEPSVEISRTKLSFPTDYKSSSSKDPIKAIDEDQQCHHYSRELQVDEDRQSNDLQEAPGKGEEESSKCQAGDQRQEEQRVRITHDNSQHEVDPGYGEMPKEIMLVEAGSGQCSNLSDADRYVVKRSVSQGAGDSKSESTDETGAEEVASDPT